MANPFSVDWYPDSFLGAVLRWTKEQVGAYTLLLNNQIHGRFSDQEAVTICGSTELWNFLRQKFTQDENGLWYNLKMDKEIIKKHAYINSRINNAKSGTNKAYAPAYAKPYAPAYVGQGQGIRIKDREKVKEEGVQGEETPEWLRPAWAEWVQHLKEKRCRTTPSAFKKQLEKLIGWGDGRAQAAIKYSIEGSYQGIFEPKENRVANFGRKELTPESFKEQMEYLAEKRGVKNG